ncbi:MAG: YHYH protein [Cyanobacteria bacterium P01_A01_bin.137]
MTSQYQAASRLLSVGMIFVFVSACQIQTDGDSPGSNTIVSPEDPVVAQTVSAETVPVDPMLFLEDGVVGDITEEPCTLSGGTETTCYRITVTSIPIDHEAGPWCPGTITDSAEAGGIWPEDGVVHDVDGPFVENLDTFYDDDVWKLFNDDGSIRVTNTAEQCAAAARPDVDAAYQNYCVQCQLSYLEEDAVYTYVIPTKPVKQDVPSQTGRGGPGVVGLALNGVNFDPPAPTDAILDAHTLAPFDDCGGHVNLNGGYHYHAHTGCPTEVEQADSHAPMIGYALDGFPLYALLDADGEEPSELDQCRGDYDETRGYHYHVADAGSNSFINCFQGEYGCKLEGNGDGQLCDAASAATGRPANPEDTDPATTPDGPPPGRPDGPPPGDRPGPPPTS